MNNLENEISNCLKDSASNLYPSSDLRVKVFSKLKPPKIKKHKFINKNLFIELSEVAVFIFVIIAVPIFVSHSKSISNITANQQSSTNAPIIKTSSINTFSKETPDKPFTIEQKDINGTHIKGKLLIISNPLKVKIGYSRSEMGFDRYRFSDLFQTTSELAKENGAVCAINAGAFKSRTSLPYLDPTDIVLHEGKVPFNQPVTDDKINKFSIVGLDVNGKLIIGDYTYDELKQLQVKEAVSNVGPSLIINGKLTDVSNDYGVNARTAIGQKSDGSIIFLVIDGKIDTSIGASLNEIQKILLNNGAVTAANLDGGISSTMFYQGKIINTPFDKTGESLVPSVFMVIP